MERALFVVNARDGETELVVTCHRGGGFAQFVGTAGVGLGEGNDRTVVIAGSVADATAQATMQTMNKFLNRLPTITIREGHRVKVYLTGDLELPEYKASVASSRF